MCKLHGVSQVTGADCRHLAGNTNMFFARKVSEVKEQSDRRQSF